MYNAGTQRGLEILTAFNTASEQSAIFNLNNTIDWSEVKALTERLAEKESSPYTPDWFDAVIDNAILELENIRRFTKQSDLGTRRCEWGAR